MAPWVRPATVRSTKPWVKLWKFTATPAEKVHTRRAAGKNPAARTSSMASWKKPPSGLRRQLVGNDLATLNLVHPHRHRRRVEIAVRLELEGGRNSLARVV